jgi:hypothetical protein
MHVTETNIQRIITDGNSKNLELVQIPIAGKMHKQIIVYS